MNLLVTQKEERKYLETYWLSQKDFGRLEFHPFIATTQWDKVVVEVSDATPTGYLRQLASKVRVVPIINKDELTSHCMAVLCEILPDDAAIIRLTFITKRKDFPNLLDELDSKYGWSETIQMVIEGR